MTEAKTEGRRAMAKLQGRPCWYELCTSDGSLGAAEDFYGKVLGWTFNDSGMPDFQYHLAGAGGDLVAGLMNMPAEPKAAGMPPFWLLYFAVDDADGTAADAKAAGGSVLKEPADIPGTGRFAILADPQGAGFGVLQPQPMAEGGEGGNAFDQKKPGHGSWHELMSTDPEAGFRFYSGLFGWTKGETVPMPEAGTYQLFRYDGTNIGGMMRLGNAPVPAWLAYFSVDGVDPAVERIKAAGGKIAHGPMEVPGGDNIAVAQDPQGAWFAIVGPKAAA
jgi:predicted enzyme related to lactoylglutathione lyase